MKIALQLVPPFWLGFFRFGSASLCLFAFAAIRGTLRLPTKADLPIVLSIGLFQMMMFTGLGLFAMQFTDAGRASLLAYTTPLWSVLLAWMLGRQAPTHLQWLALALGLSGIAVICSPFDMDWTNPAVQFGNGLLILAAMFWSVAIFHVRRHTWVMSPVDLAPWQMLLAAVPLLGFALGMEGVPTDIEWTPNLIAIIVYFGPIATSACFVIAADCGRRISAYSMSNVTLGVPLLGIVASVAFLGEPLTAALVIGVLLIGAGALTATFAVKRKAAQNAETALRNARGAQGVVP